MPKIPLRSRILNIKSLMILLAFFVALITLINGFYASYKVQRSQLIQQTLDTNYAYAQKLATAIDSFLVTTHQQLAFSASIIEKNLSDQALLLHEVKRLNLQTDTFNSTFIVNNLGFVLASSPSTLGVTGGKLLDSGSIESLEAKVPLISTPYLSSSNNYLILISFPLFDSLGNYLGYIGGTVYLKKNSILNDILGQHYHKDGSYIYLIDEDKKIIFHPKSQRIGDYISDNTAINQVTRRVSGSVQTTNSLGIEMLAGFVPIAATNWGIVAQRPTTETLSSLNKLMKQVVFRTIPIGIFTFIFMWMLANYISQPLRQLADTVKNINTTNIKDDLTNVSSWYFESHELKQAMLKGLNSLSTQIYQLKKDAATDPLTGAFNRRSLELLLEQLEEKEIPFSALAIDIDHFKKVNDTFGHPAGDKALIELTQAMLKVSRKHDLVARTGGEEFLLILPNTSSEVAQIIAERLRNYVATMLIEPIGTIQISIGIASSTECLNSSEEVLKQADKALYQAKTLGRNRCETFDSLLPSSL